MKILVINGPNINLLGIREPDVYGTDSYADLCRRVAEHASRIGVTVELFQSNHEGDLVDKIQTAYDRADGIVINPAAYTHTSIAIRDAIKAVGIPTVEVHISDPDQREPFRRVNYVRDVCQRTVAGHGINGYLEAMDFLMEEAGPTCV